MLNVLSVSPGKSPNRSSDWAFTVNCASLLVLGPWGEVSKDMHSLVKVLAESNLAAKARARRRKISDGAGPNHHTDQKISCHSLCAGTEPVFAQ